MTSTGDVKRQAETALNDTRYPPTLEGKEILSAMLHRVFICSVHVAESR